MSVYDEQLNAEKIPFKYSEVLLPDREHIYPRDKFASFASMCYCSDKYIKFSKRSCIKFS